MSRIDREFIDLDWLKLVFDLKFWVFNRFVLDYYLFMLESDKVNWGF